MKNPKLKKWEGKTVAEIAAARGVDGVDALLDVTLEDDLENEFTVQSRNTRVDRMTELLNDPAPRPAKCCAPSAIPASRR